MEKIVSRALAFRYAGSESLLTDLWKLDEKSSMEITDGFLYSLGTGKGKKQGALREAKLRDLAGASVRALSPDYWAGLVLIGDPELIAGLHRSNRWQLWLAGIVALLLVALVLSRKKLRQQRG
ncbi:CHAT domain-containing protein [Cyclobacterium xiamenense]|uniref:CHAT domain-containing protein n=1 Tax=Cyclobacterium xiamenense TaxID=1297121 RepID=A0A1H6ULK8_9BACT|nr:CHAT domain-containing protein [Cyclobacterium xiamenense]SEI88752.1 CHAT domain-containing protein [Cyclobacterium xiamenense]